MDKKDLLLTMNKDEIFKELKKYLYDCKYKEHIKKIGIFGSVARGEISPDSDIDIFVDLSPVKAFDLIGIKQDIEKLTGQHVDIVTIRENMNPFLKSKIEREGIVVR